jgi:hypothetical protein
MGRRDGNRPPKPKKTRAGKRKGRKIRIGKRRRAGSSEFYFARIKFPPGMKAHLDRHSMTSTQVREAIECGHFDTASWTEDEAHGRRVVATGRLYDGGPIIVYLRPIDSKNDIWKCSTAWRL